MSIAPALGLTTDKKVRHAVVALGDISQEAMLPGVNHTGNAEVIALVTGDLEKARGVGAQYALSDVYGYEQFGAMLRLITLDALYLATPNWRHAEFAVSARDAGIHVLVGKPLEVSLEAARAILDAQKRSRARRWVKRRRIIRSATPISSAARCVTSPTESCMIARPSPMPRRATPTCGCLTASCAPSRAATR